MDKKSEYEIQHFGFPVAQISLERNYILKKFVGSALDGLTAKLTTSPQTKKLLEDEKVKVHEEILQSFGEQLNALEELDKKTFSIPSHVLLPSDFMHSKQYSEQDEQQLDEELKELKRLFLENSVMIAALKTENALHDSLETHLQKELDFCKDALQLLKPVPLQNLCELVDGAKKVVSYSKR